MSNIFPNAPFLPPRGGDSPFLGGDSPKEAIWGEGWEEQASGCLVTAGGRGLAFRCVSDGGGSLFGTHLWNPLSPHQAFQTHHTHMYTFLHAYMHPLSTCVGHTHKARTPRPPYSLLCPELPSSLSLGVRGSPFSSSLCAWLCLVRSLGTSRRSLFPVLWNRSVAALKGPAGL